MKFPKTRSPRPNEHIWRHVPGTPAMSGWRQKRFWSATHVVSDGAGYSVHLDARPVKTPAKAALRVPTRAMADAIAAEWDAQDGEVRPSTMPVTRTANAAIDKVAIEHAAVADMIAAYGGADLICYRAEAPADLVARQSAAWDPLMEWALKALGTRLIATTGVMHVPQSAEALERFGAEVHALDAFRLAALHDLVTLSGSLVIGLAVIRDALAAGDLWQRSRIDEIWQEEKWGFDPEAAAAAAAHAASFARAAKFYRLCAG